MTQTKETYEKIDKFVKVYQSCEYYKVYTEKVHGIELLKVVFLFSDGIFEISVNRMRDLVIFADKSVSILLIGGGYFTFNFYDRKFTLSI